MSLHHKNKYGCDKCNFITNDHHSKCPNCGADIMWNLGSRARPPKKRAKKKVWDSFWKMFKSQYEMDRYNHPIDDIFK